jgi:UDP-N-acetylmuramate dehydrogenase
VPLGETTTLRVGGRADLYMEACTRGDLSLALAWAKATGAPIRVVGQGSNVLVSDLGVRGLTVRLRGDAFLDIREQGNETVVGAAVPLGRLLDRLEALGRGGLEFLEGIPGCVGGALRMNAGAGGDGIGRSVSWIRCLNPDGSERIVSGSKLGFGYRCCGALRHRVAVEAGLALPRRDRATIRQRRGVFAGRRAWMRGLRCAGSVFRNPPDDHAGRLIEQAGLKGVAIGGAEISRAHANVIVTSGSARASDVRALIETARAEVAARSGVVLEEEIEYLS